MGVANLMDRAPYGLSGGEKKRVAIASVIAIEPQVLLMDEPTANLDPRSKWRLVDFVLDYAKRGATIVIATHDLDVVDALADVVYVMNEDNFVAAQGKPQEVLKNEALLVGCNLLHEHVHQHGDVRHLHRHYHADEHDHEHV
jgi:cobalt/nickel transport system ATP-binding protein